MKFKVGDKVIVTAGKDKGIKSEVIRVLPKSDRVVVKDANKYVKHVKPMGGRAGERVVVERPLPVAKVAILNDKDQADRIGYKSDSAGTKTRIFKKTGVEIPYTAPAAEKK